MNPIKPVKLTMLAVSMDTTRRAMILTVPASTPIVFAVSSPVDTTFNLRDISMRTATPKTTNAVMIFTALQPLTPLPAISIEPTLQA